LLSGFFGIGGGWVITPALNFLGMPMSYAVGTGLAFIFGTSLISVFRHRRHGNISVRIGVSLAVAMLAGIHVGKMMVLGMENQGMADSVLRALYMLFLFTLGGFMIWEFLHGPGRADHGDGRLGAWVRRMQWRPTLRLSSGEAARVSLWPVLGIGLFTGLFSGMLGLGGGVLIVPTLIYLFGLSPVMAVGTSLFCILLSSPVGVTTYAVSHRVEFWAAGVMVAGAVVGAPIGVAATKWVKGGHLKALYGGIQVLGGVAVGLKEFGYGTAAFTLLLAAAGGMAICVLALAWQARRRAARSAARAP